MTRLRASLAALRDRRDAGVSLAELLVAMMVFAILIAITGGFMVSASRASSQTQSIDSATRVATNGMTAVTRTLRAATENPVKGQTLPDAAFPQATANAVTVYAYVNLASSDATPVMVQYYLDGTALKEKTWPGVVSTDGFWTFGTTPKTRTVASPLVTGTDLFAYVDADGATISLAAGAVPAAKIASIAAVRVRVQAGTANTPAASTTLVNTVGLPNLDIARDL